MGDLLSKLMALKVKKRLILHIFWSKPASALWPVKDMISDFKTYFVLIFFPDFCAEWLVICFNVFNEDFDMMFSMLLMVLDTHPRSFKPIVHTGL